MSQQFCKHGRDAMLCGDCEDASEAGRKPRTAGIKCPYCEGRAHLVGGDTVYPHRPDLSVKNFYLCMPCDAFVGCHPAGNGRDGTEPMGTPANKALRKARNAAHAALDPIWKNALTSRRGAYKWLSGKLGIHPDRTHIAMFNEEQCWQTVEAVKKEFQP